jgi:simple sugar transport system permease protein
LCGLINGYLVYKFAVPGIIVSLGMAQIYNTLMIVVCGVSYIPTLPAGMRAFSRKFVLEIPTALGNATISMGAVMFLASILLVWFVLNKTMVGRGIYALGGDKVAAARAGFNMPLVYGTAYGIMGVLCGIAGMMYYANNTLFQSDWILAEQADATAGAIFGGVILKDGKGSVGGVVLGIFLIGLIRNNLYLIGVPSYAQKLVVGVIIFTPSIRMAWSYTLREGFGMTTWFFSPVRSGSRCIRSGFAPARHAAVACVSAAAHPAVTIPHSAFVISARRRPTPSISSSRWI